MREIKFRFWHKEDKQFFSPWVRGWRFEGENGQIYVNGMNVTDRAEIMQFTGLKDKNGVEIYEGDILQDSQGRGEVQWFQEHCGFKVYSNHPSPAVYHLEADSQLKDSEVVGNIYANPDLLRDSAIDANE